MTREFSNIIYSYYRDHGRSMPWRDNTDPYWVLVSEIMLQQTQVSRVEPKFCEFIEEFPSVNTLANAAFSDVLKVWSGLGYNRRAKFLHQLAQKVMSEFDGNIPATRAELEPLPGIGPNTAGAILAYAFNQPVIFIETNIRTVFIHHFLSDQEKVDDKQLLPLIKQTLDRDNPREWYWALMDYGVYLKQALPNPSRASAHHAKQSRFEGSKRQIRGQVLRELLEGPQDLGSLSQKIPDDRLDQIIDDLQAESLIQLNKSVITLRD